ncbi:MAG TPA: endolytic transglycosylase MltG [Longilinea sp.]|nr:endolytic transglycosylase MltG [Longilinea sp.]
MTLTRRSGCTCFVVFSILMLLCFLAAAYFAVVYFPKQAVDLYGQPSPNLGFFQRLNLSVRLVLDRNNLLTASEYIDGQQSFAIDPGDSVNLISLNLEQAGLIPSAEDFRLYLIYMGLDTSVKSGEYLINPGMTAVDIAQAIQNPISQEVVVAILPGWRAEEIAVALISSGLNIAADDFMRLVNNPDSSILPADLQGVTNLEGFLTPGKYHFTRDASAQAVLANMLLQFDQQITPDMLQAFHDQGLTLEQAVTLASIVQKEAVVADEMPMIASVFYNRLAVGMKLESDPTVQYALGYNTYANAGLPPGPICDPGLAALSAVAHPAQTPYYYFRARCDGSSLHAFATTFEEHQQNACP